MPALCVEFQQKRCQEIPTPRQLLAPGLSFRAGTMNLHPRKQMHSTCPETNKWRYSFLPQPGILILLINKAEGKNEVSECFLCFR